MKIAKSNLRGISAVCAIFSMINTKKNKIKLDDVYNLKDNSPPIQFLELNLFKLEENGMCLFTIFKFHLFPLR